MTDHAVYRSVEDQKTSSRGTCDADVDDCQSSIDLVLGFAEFRDLEGAFGRRASIERANGIVMERHSIAVDVAVAHLRHAK